MRVERLRRGIVAAVARLLVLVVAVVGVAALGRGLSSNAAAQDEGGHIPNKRFKQGLAIAPVPLNLEGKSRKLVGLGSYIVNAQSACSDCHTEPPFAEGGDPYLGEPTIINASRYLAGGRDFGNGIVSANITPDENGLPAGLTEDEFIELLRTGMDEDEPGHILAGHALALLRQHDRA